MYLTVPLKGFPLEFGIGTESEETRMMRLPGGRKGFSRFDTILACDTQTPSQPRYRSKYRAYYCRAGKKRITPVINFHIATTHNSLKGQRHKHSNRTS